MALVEFVIITMLYRNLVLGTKSKILTHVWYKKKQLICRSIAKIAINPIAVHGEGEISPIFLIFEYLKIGNIYEIQICCVYKAQKVNRIQIQMTILTHKKWFM